MRSPQSAAMKIEIPIEQTYPPVKLGQANSPAPAVQEAPATAVKERPKPGPTAVPKAAPSSLANQLQEVDVWYGGYAGRDMIGGFLVCCLWTFLVVGYLAPQCARMLAMDSRFEYWIDVGLAGGVWLFQLFRWVYRKLAYQVRITTRHLVLQRGFLYHWEIQPLSQLARIDVRQHFFERILRIGRIHLAGTTPDVAISIRGIAQPQFVADKIRQRLPSREQPA